MSKQYQVKPDELNNIKMLVRSVVLSYSDGLPLSKFMRAYRNISNEFLDFQKLGYNNIEEFIKSMPDVARIRVLNDEKIVFGIAKNSLVYINPTAAKSERHALQEDLICSSSPNNIDEKATIFLGNLPSKTTKAEVNEHFKNYKIYNLRIMDKNNKKYGFFECDFLVSMEILNNECLNKFKNGRKIFIQLSKNCQAMQGVLAESKIDSSIDTAINQNDKTPDNLNSNEGTVVNKLDLSTSKSLLLSEDELFASQESDVVSIQSSSQLVPSDLNNRSINHEINCEKIAKFSSDFNESNGLSSNKRINSNNCNDSNIISNNYIDDIKKNDTYDLINCDNSPKRISKDDIFKFQQISDESLHLPHKSQSSIPNNNSNIFANLCTMKPSLKLFIRELIKNKKLKFSTTREHFRETTKIYNCMDVLSFSGITTEIPAHLVNHPIDFPISMLPNVMGMITEQLMNKSARIEKLIFPDKMILLVTSVELKTNRYFWGIIFDPLSPVKSCNFVKLHTELQHYAPQFLPDEYMEPRAAIFVNQIWCRVWIKVRFVDHLIVFLIDYGLTLLVKNNEIYNIPEELWNYKPMALPFKSFVDQDMTKYLDKCIAVSIRKLNLPAEVDIIEIVELT